LNKALAKAALWGLPLGWLWAWRQPQMCRLCGYRRNSNIFMRLACFNFFIAWTWVSDWPPELSRNNVACMSLFNCQNLLSLSLLLARVFIGCTVLLAWPVTVCRFAMWRD